MRNSAQCPVPSAQCQPFRSGRAFTIIEAMIVMGIIALLGGILLLAIGKVRKTGDTAAEQGMVSAMKQAVVQFKQQFGFLPPLVNDAAPGPVNPSGVIQIWTTSDLGNDMPTLNNGNRYSVYSLPYYIAGALDDDYDGVRGLGFTAPDANRDGQFTRKGRSYAPLFDPTQQKTKTGALRFYMPNPTSANAAQKVKSVIWDRWSDGSLTSGLSIPIRYYRWLPTYWAPGTTKAGQIQFWNIPVAIGGNVDNTMPPIRFELRDAEYAIVSAGPNRLFGDEDPAAIKAALGLDPTVSDDVARARAAEDNIVEVGK